MKDKNEPNNYEPADKFARNFYLERKAILDRTFGDIEKSDLDEKNKEEVKRLVSNLLTDTFYTILTGLDGCTEIGESGQETYKIYDEKETLISDCGELEAEAYEYFHGNKYETKNSKADFIATLTYKTSEEGGRKTPAKSGYRPQIKFDFEEMQTSCEQIFIERNMVYPGETVKAEITLLSVPLFGGRLKEGMKFEFREGNSIIGTGIINHIINAQLKID